MQRKVERQHRPVYDYSVRFKPGEKVKVGREDTEDRNWFWCTNSAGASIWVPIDFITINGTEGTILENYDTVEASVDPGETVEVLREVQGWAWCRIRGGLGWIPLRALQP